MRSQMTTARTSFPMNSRALFCICVHFRLPPPVHGASGSRAPAQTWYKTSFSPVLDGRVVEKSRDFWSSGSHQCPQNSSCRFSLQRKPNRYRMIFWFWTKPAINATPCRRWRLSCASRWHAEKLALAAPAAAMPRCLLCCAKVSLFLPQPRRERKIPPLREIRQLPDGLALSPRPPAEPAFLPGLIDRLPGSARRLFAHPHRSPRASDPGESPGGSLESAVRGSG